MAICWPFSPPAKPATARSSSPALGDDVTVARLRRTANAIEVAAENPDYPVIVVQPGEPEIEGLAVGLIRNTMLM